MKQFQTESKKLMELMIHSIYTNQEIFLRELLSNASDAIDKMYVKSLQDENILFDKDKFFIEIKVDKEKRSMTIIDTGIGMTKDELESNLGTIAHSGSLDFKNANKTEDAMNIIGQFGVGFYSAFMVAKKVEVLTKAYGEDKAYLWISESSEGYSIEEIEKENVGTEITLYFREDGEENYSQYLEEFTIKNLVKQYSNYVRYPIKMEVTHSRRVDNESEKDKAPEYEEYTEVETLNSMIPIWNKSKKDLSDSDYIEFYNQEHFGFDEPLAWTHMVADGLLSYRAILYLPGAMPFDFYTKEYKKGLELYSSGVKIMDSCEELLPDYYSFVKGVVSSEDVSLNISREVLQQNRQLKAIAKKIESKITDELKKMLENDREKYETFFHLFGSQLKSGIYQSYGMKKDTLADLLIFATSDGDKKKTLKEVIEGYSTEIADKKKIYYATGDSVDIIDTLPALQAIKSKGIEILYLVDDIDEFMLKLMNDYNEYSFQSVLAEDFSLDDEEVDKEKTEEEKVEDEQRESLFECMKAILDDEVVEVKESKRLLDDAVVLVAQGDISIDMEKTFMNQPGVQKLTAQKILEINTNHPVYDKLLNLKDTDEEKFEQYTKILYNQARLIAGLPIENPVEFTKSIQKLM